MNRKAAEILKDALALPADARAALAASLLDSFSPHLHEAPEASWVSEINRRIGERRQQFVRARHRALRRLREGLDLRWVPGSREDLHRR